MCRFTLGYFGVPLGIGLFAVASRFLGNGFHSWWSGRQSSVKTVQSSHLLILSGLNANLNDDGAKETMENHDIYIYINICVFRHKLPCLSRELVGNLGNYWKP